MTDSVAQFKALHVPGDPLVLFNIWDAGSAKAVAAVGAKAIARGSYGVAEAHGLKDGEALPIELAVANLERIVSAVEVPVTIDMEAGYGDTPEEVRASVARARDAGAAGINMEDRMPGTSELVPIEQQAERLAAASESGLFVNARCDVFRGRDAAAEGETLVAETLERARAYADAGGSGLFVPFLGDRRCIEAICVGSPLPVNVLWRPEAGDCAALAALGVARISHGHQPWAAAMAWLTEQAKVVLDGGVPHYAG